METVGKVNRRFASVLAVMSVLTLTAPVFAADADFNGEGASPVWAYDTLSVRAYGYDAFGDATKDLAPGAIRSLSVRLRNNTADTVEFRLAADPLTGARAEALETGFPGKTADDSLLDAIGITVRHGAAQLYVGTLRGLAADGDAALYGNAGVSLGLVSGGYSGLIEVTLSVPSSLPSSAMDTLCAVSWRFAATQYNDPPPKPQEPDNPPGAQSPPDPQSPAGQSARPDAGAAQSQGEPPILDDTPAAELQDADVPASPGSPDVN
ncbi:MAG: hypothetical protein LBO81_01950, partial [Clostridiales Family XIII bacterium]|nr:hypothetical protein [Clostridiales Family XIII bacterium]